MLGLAALAAVLYASAWRRLRRRGRPDLARVSRALAFAAGLVVVVLAIASPLDPIGEEFLFSGHMLQHILIADVGPLLLVVGLAGPLALMAVPKPLLRGVARTRPLRASARVVALPVTAAVVWIVVMVGWHVPAAFELALEHRWAHDLEHASMFLAGFLVWSTLVGIVPRRRLSEGRRAALAVGLLVAGMVVSQWIFASDPLYAAYREQDERLFGLSPEGDQTRAALMMGADQLLTLGTAAALLVWTHVERAAALADPAGMLPPPTGATGRGRSG